MKNFDVVLRITTIAVMILAILLVIDTIRRGSRDKNTIIVIVPGDSITDMGVVITPEAVEVSDLETKMIAYPDSDEGEGIELTFHILLQFENKVHEAKVHVEAFCEEKGKVKKNDNIIFASLIHETLKDYPPGNLQVTLVDGEVIKLATKAIFIAEENLFIPSRVFWDKSW